jgi:hypothetical protein
MNGTQRIDYVLSVWHSWRDKRGGGYPDLSSAEYDLVRRIMDEDVPLRIVLRGIQDCGQPPSEKTSLLYAEPAIKEAIAHWVRSQTA